MTYNIDSRRIYLTGSSMGGYGAWATAAEFPNTFEAIAPICGGGNAAAAAAFQGLRVWAFHGANDKFIPLAESTTMVEAVREAGGNAQLTVY